MVGSGSGADSEIPEGVLDVASVFPIRNFFEATFTAFEQERLTPGAPRMLYLGIQGRWPERSQ